MKATYDPTNRFRRNQNIPPAAGTRADEAHSAAPASRSGVATA